MRTCRTHVIINSINIHYRCYCAGKMFFFFFFISLARTRRNNNVNRVKPDDFRGTECARARSRVEKSRRLSITTRRVYGHVSAGFPWLIGSSRPEDLPPSYRAAEIPFRRRVSFNSRILYYMRVHACVCIYTRV